MTYAVKELFYTVQGEGANTGRAAVFCRFAGCNLWSGREQDRTDAVCKFCDTDFVGTDGSGGGKFRTAAELATSKPMERSRRPKASTGFASAPRPARPSPWAGAARSSWCFRRKGSPPRNSSRWTSGISSCSRWTARRGWKTRAR